VACPRDLAAGSGILHGIAPPVAIAVVSWNTRELLRACLASVADSVAAGRAEVCVVDNGSSDGSPGVVRSEFPWAELVEPASNLGFGAAVNLAASRTSSEWIAPSNADVALESGALEALLAAGSRDPGIGVVAPRLVRPDGSTEQSAFPFPSAGVFLGAGLGRMRPANPDRPREIDWGVGAFLLVRRAAFDQAGGFDERQWMYAEDLDLGWRLKQAGWATRYEPRALVDHENAASTKQLFGPELAPHWQRSTYGFLARRRGAAYAWAIALLNLSGALPRYLRAIYRAARDPDRYAAERGAYGRWVLVHVGALRRRATLESFR